MKPLLEALVSLGCTPADSGEAELRIIERRRLAFLLYPLSGGFSRRPLIPAALYRPLAALETLLTPAAPLLAYRCLVVLERTD